MSERQDMGAIPGGATRGFRPLSEFLAEQNARGIARHGWLRWKLGKLRARIAVRWRLRLYYWRNPKAIKHVSPEAIAAVSADQSAYEGEGK